MVLTVGASLRVSFAHNERKKESRKKRFAENMMNTVLLTLPPSLHPSRCEPVCGNAQVRRRHPLLLWHLLLSPHQRACARIAPPRNHLPEGKQMPSFTLFGALCLFGSPGLGPKRKKRRAVSLVPLLPKELRNEHLRGFVIQTASATNDADFRRLR